MQAVFTKEFPVPVFSVSIHQAIEVVDEAVVTVTLVGDLEEIHMFLVLSLCYPEWVDPVFRVVSEYINRNPILPLEFRHILQLHRKLNVIEVQLCMEWLVFKTRWGFVYAGCR